MKPNLLVIASILILQQAVASVSLSRAQEPMGEVDAEKIPPLVSPRCWSIRQSSNIIVANLPHDPLIVQRPTDVDKSLRLCSPLGDTFEARALIEGLPKGLDILRSTSTEASQREKAAKAFTSLWVTYKIKYSPATEVLRAVLHDEDRTVRREGAIALAHYGNIAIARQTLLDEAEFKLLAELGDRASIPQIRAALDSKRLKERGHALFALIEFHEPEATLVPAIRKGLEDPEDVIRATYVRALGELAGPDSRALLKDLMAHDGSQYIRELAEQVYRRLKSGHQQKHE